MIDGFRLEFSDSTVFRATEGVSISHETTPLYLLDGFENVISMYNQYIDDGGQSNKSDSNYSGAFAGFGAGVHTIRIEFLQFEGSSDSWGDASANDHAITKLDTFNHALTNKQADSKSPAELQVGEYEDDGKYDPIPVALGETNLTWSPEERVSEFTGSVEFLDTVDLSEAIDAEERAGR